MRTHRDVVRSVWAWRAGIGACALAAVLAVPATAGAQQLHSASRHAGSSPVVAGRRHGGAQKRVHFSLNGLVQSDSNGLLGVYVARGEIGGRHVRNVVEHVIVDKASHKAKPARSKHAASATVFARAGKGTRPIVVGDIVHLSGTVDQSGDSQTLDATHENIVNTRSTGVSGTIVSVAGTTIDISPTTTGTGGDNSQGDGIAVDASQATVLLDGVSSSVTSLATGETVAVIGEKNDGTMVATTVLAYDNAPAVALGHISAISGSVLTLTGRGDSGAVTSVDSTSASIYLNGVGGSAVSQLQAGDRVIALGTAGSNPLAASAILAFNSGDQHPTGDNNGDQGNQFQVVTGTVASISGTTITITPTPSSASNSNGGDGGSNRGSNRGSGIAGGHNATVKANDQGNGSMTVDASQATVLFDGSASSVGSLVSGDVVVVVGTRGDGTMTAATVLAYDATSAISIGTLTSVTGVTLNLRTGDNESTVPSSVNGGGATIYLDGVAGATVGQLQPGDLVIAVGTKLAGTLSAVAIVAFDQQGDN